MRSKALTIALAVTGYLAIEAALIWYSRFLKNPEMVILVSTLGMLAGFIWGGRLSAKHVLKVEGAVIGSPLLLGAFFLATSGFGYVFGAAYDGVCVHFDISWIAPVVVCLVFLYFLLLLSSPTVFFFVSRRLPYRGLNAAAEQWLSDRARYGSAEMRRRSRMKRWSLCLPTLTVLLVLSVWAPLQGTLSYPLKWRAGHLAGGNVRVPLSWSAFQQEGPGDWFTCQHKVLVVERVHGLLPATILFGRKWAYSSDISIRWDSAPDPDYSLEKSVEEARERDGFRFHPLSGGLPNMTCWENDRTSLGPWTRDLYATCATENGEFLAEFGGVRADLDSFYEIISSAEIRK